MAEAIIQVPLGIVLGFPLGWGAFGVWVSFPIAFAVRAALATVVYKRGKWAKVGVHVT